MYMVRIFAKVHLQKLVTTLIKDPCEIYFLAIKLNMLQSKKQSYKTLHIHTELPLFL